MTNHDYSIGPIMKAARKFKKFNQAEVAEAIGCSQSALSKMEHDLLVPSAPQWFLFARFTAIPPETLETGVIDRHSQVKFNSTEVSLGFKIPKKYRQSRAVKVREIYPFLHFLHLEAPDEAKAFVTSTDIDPEFFLDFDNLVNFNLIADAINYFIQTGRNTPDAIRKLVQVGQNEVYWNHYRLEWMKLSTPQQVLNEYCREQTFFQTDFQIKVEGLGDRLTLSYFPEYHIKQIGASVTPEQTEFLNQYRKYSIENLIKNVINKDVTVDFIQESQGNPLGARFSVQAAAA